MAEKMTELENVKVLVTERPSALKDESTIKTPAGQADITVVTSTWYAQVLIRFARTYVQGLVGFLVAGQAGLPGPLPVTGFGAVLINAASLALAPAVVSLLQNAVEILSRLDETAPKLRA